MTVWNQQEFNSHVHRIITRLSDEHIRYDITHILNHPGLGSALAALMEFRLFLRDVHTNRLCGSWWPVQVHGSHSSLVSRAEVSLAALCWSDPVSFLWLSLETAFILNSCIAFEFLPLVKACRFNYWNCTKVENSIWF